MRNRTLYTLCALACIALVAYAVTRKPAPTWDGMIICWGEVTDD